MPRPALAIASVATDSAPSPEVTPARAALMAHAARLDRELDALKCFFDRATVETRGLSILSVLDVRLDFDLPHNVCERIFDNLHREASRVLSTTDIPLDLDINAVYDRFFTRTSGYGRFEPKRGFTAARVMEAMLAAWEPSARSQEDAQLAQWLYNEFAGRRHSLDPRIVGGRTVLTQSAWVDDRFTGKDYSYSSREQIRKAAYRLSVMLARLDSEMSETDANVALTRCMRDFEREQWKPSREFRAHLGPIEIRTYQKKVEYYLPQAFAEALNLFVSSHAKQDDAR